MNFFLEGLFAVCTCTSFTSMLTRYGTFWMLSQWVSMQTNNFCRFLTLLHFNKNDLNSIFNCNIFSLFHIHTHMRENITVLSFEKTIKISMQFCWLYQPFSKTKEQNPSFYHCRVFNHINYAIQDHELVFKIYLCIAHPLNKDHCHLHKVKYIHPWNNQKDILAYTQKYKWMYIHEIRK